MILETEIREFREFSRSRNTSRQIHESTFINGRYNVRFIECWAFLIDVFLETRISWKTE
jgi:hypothetical protein